MTDTSILLNGKSNAMAFTWLLDLSLFSLIVFALPEIHNLLGDGTVPVLDKWFATSSASAVGFTLIISVALLARRKTTNVSVYMQAATQGLLSFVVIISVYYLIIAFKARHFTLWQLAFFPRGGMEFNAPIGFAVIAIMLVLSFVTTFSFTPPNKTNYLFFNLQSFVGACLFFPVLNEISTNGLMICSNYYTDTFAFLYVNLSLGTSMLLSLLDSANYNPSNLLPEWMSGQNAVFKVYNLLHGVLTGAFLFSYLLTTKVSMSTFLLATVLLGLLTISTFLSSFNILHNVEVALGIEISEEELTNKTNFGTTENYRVETTNNYKRRSNESPYNVYHPYEEPIKPYSVRNSSDHSYAQDFARRSYDDANKAVEAVEVAENTESVETTAIPEKMIPEFMTIPKYQVLQPINRFPNIPVYLRRRIEKH